MSLRFWAWSLCFSQAPTRPHGHSSSSSPHSLSSYSLYPGNLYLLPHPTCSGEFPKRAPKRCKSFPVDPGAPSKLGLRSVMGRFWPSPDQGDPKAHLSMPQSPAETRWSFVTRLTSGPGITRELRCRKTRLTRRRF